MSAELPPLHAQRLLGLMHLFPPGGHCYNVLVEHEGSRKVAPLRKRTAQDADYLNHLQTKHRDTCGALGLPALVRSSPRTAHTSFIALDLDATKPLDDDAQPLFDTLHSLELRFYVTTGTTGRGMHLYVFSDPLITAAEGSAAAKALAQMVRDAGLPLDKVLPHAPDAFSSTIFIPYYGALSDGIGLNPLLDPAQDLRPVILERVTDLERSSGAVLRRLSQPSRPQHLAVAPKQARLIVADARAAFGKELERLRPLWVRGVRQRLTLAVTALALLRLDLEPEAILEALEPFWRETNDDEPAERRRAYESTCAAFARGDPVAYLRFYDEAGVEPPQTLVGGALSEALERLNHWETCKIGSGLKGASDTKVVRTLYRAALRWGELADDGVLVRMSCRQLAELAQVSLATVTAATQRLQQDAVLVRAKVERDKDQAGAFVLLLARVPQLAAPLNGEVEPLVQTLDTHPAFRVRCLNPAAVSVVRALYEAREPLTRKALAQRLATNATNLKRPLTKLVSHKVVEKLDGEPVRFWLPDDWPARLERAAVTTGANERVSNQKALHLQARAGYADYLQRTASSSGAEPPAGSA